MIAVFMPFEDRARANRQLAPDARGDGDLALSRELGMGNWHAKYYHGNALAAEAEAEGAGRTREATRQASLGFQFPPAAGLPFSERLAILAARVRLEQFAGVEPVQRPGLGQHRG